MNRLRGEIVEQLKGLNKQQQEAVLATGNVRVIAGAGSGKTSVLTRRIAHLIEQGVPSYQILAITFTNKAAKEMKDRVIQLLGPVGAGCHVSTFHSLCVRILREDIHVLEYPKNFTILDGEDQKALLKEFYKVLNIDAKVFSYGSMLSFISSYKQKQIDPKRALEHAGDMPGLKNKALIYQMYESRLKQLHALDFDDLLIKTVLLFKTSDDILLKWVHRFKYIHVDEFQDTNDIQYELVQLLCHKRENVYVVGDPDQTIYSFRGANVHFIMDFKKDFPNSTSITLNQNYRSTQPILDGANLLIENNQTRVKKALFTETLSDHKIIHYRGFDENDESEFIAKTIESIIDQEEGANYEDFAVLYRANYLSRSVEQALIHASIDYRVFGGLKFFERREIKDMLSYFRLISNPNDDLAFQRIINVPKRGVGPKTIGMMMDAARHYGLSLYTVCFEHLNEIGLSPKMKKEVSEFVHIINQFIETDLPIDRLYDSVNQAIGYEKMIIEDQDLTRLDNLHELKQGMIAYQKRMLDQEEEPSLDHYLQEIALYTNQDDDNEDPHYVSLMTIHMAKGLEFKYVFVVGMSENVFPSLRSLEEGIDGLEEERRMAYVAYTRAKQRLYLLDSGGYSFASQGPKSTSRFISELGDHVVHMGAIRHNSMQESSFMSTKKEPQPVKLNVTQQNTISDNGITNWKVGDHLIHQKFGEGVVLKVDGDVIEVAFSVPHGVKIMLGRHGLISRKG